jgi:flagellar motor switch protein FliG
MKDMHRGVRKAAVLISCLDPDSATALLAQMPSAQAEAVRLEAQCLGPIDPDEQREVIDEFFRVGPLVPEKQPEGIELCGTIPPELTPGQIAEPKLGTAGAASGCLAALADAPARLLSRYLERERPQTIAVVLAHLSSERAAEVLAALDNDLQIEVARRLVDLEEADGEVLAEVERGLAAWLDEQTRGHRRREAGLSALHSILDAAPAHAKQHMLLNLAGVDRSLAGRVQPMPERLLRFCDVEQFDLRSLSAVLHQADTEVVALALAGARPEFAERALGVFSASDASSLRRLLLVLHPLSLSDVEEAQRRLADLAGELLKRGQITAEPADHLSVAV